MAYQDRKGDSFVVTPYYSGSYWTEYAKFSPSDGQDEVLTLGRAIAISGAAVDPSMRIWQSATSTAMLTFLDLRLGYWIANPCNNPWSGSGPSSSFWIFRELLGWTNSKSEFVHLSDGGHFENLGVYELIRRRVRFIMIIEAAEDKKPNSDNLANMIRLVRRDFGIRMEINTDLLEPDDKNICQAHSAIGTIHYEDFHADADPGYFIFVRSSLTGDESVDIKNYASIDPDFPNNSTTDQFFDERLFECYRALGYHIGTHVFEPASRLFLDADSSEQTYQRCNHNFFVKLKSCEEEIRNGLGGL